VVEDHPVVTGEGLKGGIAWLKKEATFKCGFPDFISLNPGSDGTVVVRSLKGRGDSPENVIVVGEAGKGRVVLCGMNIGCQYVKTDDKREFVAEVKEESEREILLNAVRWLAE